MTLFAEDREPIAEHAGYAGYPGQIGFCEGGQEQRDGEVRSTVPYEVQTDERTGGGPPALSDGALRCLTARGEGEGTRERGSLNPAPRRVLVLCTTTVERRHHKLEQPTRRSM
jgi:hypothetical protein